MKVFIALAVILTCSVISEAVFVDLTHVTDNDTLHWATYFPFQLSIMQRGYINNIRAGTRAWIEYNKIYMPEHIGTHMDSPAHYSDGPGRWRVDDIPVDHLIGEAVVINISHKADVDTNPDATVTIDDILEWEAEHGQIKDGSIVFAYSGWDQYWGDMDKYMGNSINNPLNYHWPGFAAETAEWIRDNRNIHGIGSDTMSYDPGNSTNQWTHQALLSTNVFGIENVNNLGDIPPAGARVYVFPMRFRDSSGTPCRIVAEFDTDYSARALHSASVSTVASLLVLTLSLILNIFS